MSSQSLDSVSLFNDYTLVFSSQDYQTEFKSREVDLVYRTLKTFLQGDSDIILDSEEVPITEKFRFANPPSPVGPGEEINVPGDGKVYFDQESEDYSSERKLEVYAKDSETGKKLEEFLEDIIDLI